MLYLKEFFQFENFLNITHVWSLDKTSCEMWFHSRGKHGSKNSLRAYYHLGENEEEMIWLNSCLTREFFWHYWKYGIHRSSFEFSHMSYFFFGNTIETYNCQRGSENIFLTNYKRNSFNKIQLLPGFTPCSFWK